MIQINNIINKKVLFFSTILYAEVVYSWMISLEKKLRKVTKHSYLTNIIENKYQIRWEKSIIKDKILVNLLSIYKIENSDKL